VGDQTIWGLFQRNYSRRDFIKFCFTVTGMLGLAPVMVPDVIARAEERPLTPVIWMHGQGCTGCSESFMRSQTPLVTDVLREMISLEYSGFLSSASGSRLEQHRDEIMRDYAGKYLVVAEGAVPMENKSYYCNVGGIPYATLLNKTIEQAVAVLAIGTCASWGGIPAALPNPTQSVAIDQIITAKAVVKIPGCPPIPEVLTSVIIYYTLFGKLPPLDNLGRPTQFFGSKIHEACPRKPFFEADQYVEQYGDGGSKAGWCLYKLGCRGLETFNSCAKIGWWQGVSFPIESGSPCIGCSTHNFGDNRSFIKPIYD